MGIVSQDMSLLEGYYKVSGNIMMPLIKNINRVTENPAIGLQIHVEYGDFGKAEQGISEASGKDNYNVKFVSYMGVELVDVGVMSTNCDKLFMKGIIGVYEAEKIDD